MASEWALAQREIQPHDRQHDCAEWGSPTPQRRSGWTGRACVGDHRDVTPSMRRLLRHTGRPLRAGKPSIWDVKARTRAANKIAKASRRVNRSR